MRDRIEQRHDPVPRKLAIRRRNQLLILPPMVAGLCAVAASEHQESLLGAPQPLILRLSATLIVGGVLFSFINWRCPACNACLGKRMNPRFCSSCGVNLRQGR